MDNLILIGFMGSGKTAIGSVLSKKLKWEMIDIDSLIVKNSGMQINEIFEKYGEKKFRDLETKELKKMVKERKKIISTGGGVVTVKGNLDVLRKCGTVVYLKNSFSTSKKRLKNATDRPLFKDPVKAKKLFDKRQKMYERFCDIKIVTDNKTKAQVAELIIKRFLTEKKAG